jgi:hypothetical protein
LKKVLLKTGKKIHILLINLIKIFTLVLYAKNTNVKMKIQLNNGLNPINSLGTVLLMLSISIKNTKLLNLMLILGMKKNNGYHRIKGLMIQLKNAFTLHIFSKHLCSCKYSTKSMLKRLNSENWMFSKEFSTTCSSFGSLY